MRLVNEDEFGAYLGILPDSLRYFTPREINLNFEVYDTRDNHNRYIAALCSRIPYDEDRLFSKFGIDFNRALPDLDEALEYGALLPAGYKWLGEIAFAAHKETEYELKAEIWDRFYSFVYGREPQTVWVAPHSGSVNIKPDANLHTPKNWIDTRTAGAAAMCAVADKTKPAARNAVFIHTTAILSAVLNLGDMGVMDEARLDAVAAKVEKKFHTRVQEQASGYKETFINMTLKAFNHIYNRRGTLDPAELERISHDDFFGVSQVIRGLKMYGQEITEYTFEGFKQALESLGRIDLKAVDTSMFPMVKAGEYLKLSGNMEKGLISSVFSSECSRFYLFYDPELIAEMLLTVKHELWD